MKAFFAFCSSAILFLSKNGMRKVYMRKRNKWDKFLVQLRLVLFWKFGKFKFW